VTVSLPPETVRRLVESIGLTAVQAHGEESPELCAAYPVPVVKALRTGPGFSVDDLAPYRRWPVLLDGFDPGARGGTGHRADWSVAAEARRAGYRVLLAGGLGPDTVREAVERVQPVAVDLNSAVETGPGIKDAARIRDALARLSDLDPPGKETWPW
jgi:phosphoribosylanthranilate isomerase